MICTSITQIMCLCARWHTKIASPASQCAGRAANAATSNNLSEPTIIAVVVVWRCTVHCSVRIAPNCSRRLLVSPQQPCTDTHTHTGNGNERVWTRGHKCELGSQTHTQVHIRYTLYVCSHVANNKIVIGRQAETIKYALWFRANVAFFHNLLCCIFILKIMNLRRRSISGK